jgi:uncharacterized protein YlzI (FlbEa/FlbD family)
MGKYRKLPIVVEAEQWFPGKEIDGVDVLWVENPSDNLPQLYQAFIRTLEGEMRVSIGDWIITGVNGEKYPCKSDIFEKTYEKVDESGITFKPSEKLKIKFEKIMNGHKYATKEDLDKVFELINKLVIETPKEDSE